MAVRIQPRALRLEATSACQLRCPSCPTATGDTRAVLGRSFLRFDDFRALVDANPQVSTIELSNYGELFLNPHILQILEYAHRRHILLTAENGSNLNTVTPQVLEGLVKHQFRQLRVSIDGASQETYGQYRVGGDFATVIENVRTINRFKRQYQSEFPRLMWQFIVFGHNEDEVETARAMAGQLGMSFRAKLAWGEFSPIRDAEAVKRATGLSVATREQYTKEHGRDYMQGTCHQLWDAPQVNWDGKLLGCCRNFWGTFGDNVFEQDLQTVLNGEKISHAREMLLGRAEAREDIPCTTCEIYQQMQRSGLWLRRNGAQRSRLGAAARWLVRWTGAPYLWRQLRAAQTPQPRRIPLMVIPDRKAA